MKLLAAALSRRIVQVAARGVGFFGREAGGGFGGVGVEAEFFEEDVAVGGCWLIMITWVCKVGGLRARTLCSKPSSPRRSSRRRGPGSAAGFGS